jgi:hypothetical protein
VMITLIVTGATAGIPADFKFKFNSTQQDFEDFYEIKGAYA